MDELAHNSSSYESEVCITTLLTSLSSRIASDFKADLIEAAGKNRYREWYAQFQDYSKRMHAGHGETTFSRGHETRLRWDESPPNTWIMKIQQGLKSQPPWCCLGMSVKLSLKAQTGSIRPAMHLEGSLWALPLFSSPPLMPGRAGGTEWSRKLAMERKRWPPPHPLNLFEKLPLWCMRVRDPWPLPRQHQITEWKLQRACVYRADAWN